MGGVIFPTNFLVMAKIDKSLLWYIAGEMTHRDGESDAKLSGRVSALGITDARSLAAVLAGVDESRVAEPPLRDAVRVEVE